MATFFRAGLLIALLAAGCAGAEPLRETDYPIDCKKDQPIKDLLRRGDIHRDYLLQETAPKGSVPEQWVQVREIHASRARSCYQAVLDAKPDHPYALLGLGFTHLVEATFPELPPERREKALLTATNFMQQTLNARPLDAQAYFYLGEIAARRDQCDRALKIFNALLSSRWAYSHVHAWIGYCHEAAGRTKEARAAYRSAADLAQPIEIGEWAKARLK
jgi:tetratricopeptide (TPR) repeat protein